MTPTTTPDAGRSRLRCRLGLHRWRERGPWYGQMQQGAARVCLDCLRYQVRNPDWSYGWTTPEEIEAKAAEERAAFDAAEGWPR